MTEPRGKVARLVEALNRVQGALNDLYDGMEEMDCNCVDGPRSECRLHDTADALEVGSAAVAALTPAEVALADGRRDWLRQQHSPCTRSGME